MNSVNIYAQALLVRFLMFSVYETSSTNIYIPRTRYQVYTYDTSLPGDIYILFNTAVYMIRIIRAAL